jgi:lysine-specific demethylase 8
MDDSLDNVARRRGLGREALWHEHLLPQVPVVLTDIGDAAPARAIDTLERARAAIGDLMLSVRPEYTRSMLRRIAEGPGADGAQAMTLAGYFDHVAATPDTTSMCIEQTAPAALCSLLEVPALCTLRDGSADTALKSNMFVGNAGNHASLHFDGDCRHVMLYQLFGKKRVIMLPVASWPALRPLVNFATLALWLAAPEDKSRIVEALGGWQTIIEPGETIVMPALVYHYVDYLDHGMSINFRFGRHDAHRFVSEQVHVDAWVQSLASATLAGDRDAALERLIAFAQRPARTPWRKYLEMHALSRELCEQLGVAPSEAPLGSHESLYARIPDIARQCILRAHLFNERLYRQERPV